MNQDVQNVQNKVFAFDVDASTTLYHNDGTTTVYNDMRSFRNLPRRSFSTIQEQRGSRVVQIGNVKRERGQWPPRRPDLMACGYLPTEPTSSFLSHLQWMMKKDILQQDMCLIGPPGSSSCLRRTTALAYAELLQREVHVVTITSNLTESDLKQRRELTASSPDGKLELTFQNAAPVDAALNGRILILDGLERASRNVLPTLNNLLEHRSMNLEDGSFLVAHDRYLELEEPSHSNLIPVHPDFRVIATAVPSPIWPGRSLDPPLRSRFQIRRVEEEIDDIYQRLSYSKAKDNTDIQSLAHSNPSLVNFVASMESASKEQPGKIWPFPVNRLASALRTLEQFPKEDAKSVFLKSYPIVDDRLDLFRRKHEASVTAFQSAWEDVVGEESEIDPAGTYRLESVTADEKALGQAKVNFSVVDQKSSSFSFLSSSSETNRTLTVPCGKFLGNKEATPEGNFCLTDSLQRVLVSMLQSHAVGNDVLLVSQRGEGKSAMASYFGRLLGYDVKLFHCYPEMTSTDLFLRHVTDPVTGETSWEPTALLQAIEEGSLVILDGAQKLRPDDALASLQALSTERDTFLPDGRRIVSSERLKEIDGIDDTNIVWIDPSFRMIALASLTKEAGTAWLSQDVVSMWNTVVVPSPTPECLRAILKSTDPEISPKTIKRLQKLKSALTDEVAADCGVAEVSTRNLIRVVRRAQTGSTSLYEAVCEVLVADLLPPTQRASLESVLKRIGIVDVSTKEEAAQDDESIHFNEDTCSIGNFSMIRQKADRPEMVPAPKFFDIPSHTLAIKDLLQDWDQGERAFLLLGNQGVGKNMVIDRLCQVANFEREYIQLHRDSTIGQITLQPTLEDGKIVWKDSPLVRAVTNGLSLVVDEADKAPTEVLAVLKGLVEDGELMLGDGRRISRHSSGEAGIIPVHPNFTLWILANRPGFPFLGNAFFRQIGDCFSTRVLSNPDLQSEINLLRAYGPSVDSSLLKSLAGSFAELRWLSDHGDVTYPYSTREAVAVVKHLEGFPDEGVVTALHNVLDFDSFDADVYGTLGQVFQRHGIPIEDYASWQKAVSRKGANLKVEFSGGDSTGDGTSSSPPPLSSPKEGKWDDNNDPHVGGNQWAGGTGGSDTAGLGGRGGPYRLDRGHKVHQVSDEAKAQVSVEAAKAARRMAEKALQERLSEINMSESEWDMYKRFVDPIRKDIANLRAILNQVDMKQTEQGWIPRQSHGELDDARLVDGVTGEKNIYKRRGTIEDSGGPSPKPKRLRFVVDVSGSMYRFNGYDSRLIRCLEATNLIMESFDGMSSRFDYSIVGHSGDSPCIKFVDFGKPPENEKQRMKILQAMIAHSQYCMAGDHTLEAMEQAIQDVQDTDDDDDSSSPIVIAISDANLERYGIHPRELGRIMDTASYSSSSQAKQVKAHCIFIASFGREAEQIKRELPVGRGHVCMETSDLPRIVRNILTGALNS